MLPPSQPTPCLVRVSNVDTQVTTEKLCEFFEFCGAISEILLIDAAEASGKKKEALVLFTSPVASNTAIMLTNARLGGTAIQVSYYFEQYAKVTASANTTGTEAPSERDQQANKIASEWIARGMFMSDRAIATAHQALTKYGVIQRVEPIVTKVTSAAFAQANKLDEQYQIKQRAQQATEYALGQAAKLGEAALKYPMVQQANDVISKTVSAANATLAESTRLYQERKKSTVDGAAQPAPVANVQ